VERQIQRQQRPLSQGNMNGVVANPRMRNCLRSQEFCIAPGRASELTAQQWRGRRSRAPSISVDAASLASIFVRRKTQRCLRHDCLGVDSCVRLYARAPCR
jgi:hypothetical protein